MSSSEKYDVVVSRPPGEPYQNESPTWWRGSSPTNGYPPRGLPAPPRMCVTDDTSHAEMMDRIKRNRAPMCENPNDQEARFEIDVTDLVKLAGTSRSKVDRLVQSGHLERVGRGRVRIGIPRNEDTDEAAKLLGDIRKAIAERVQAGEPIPTRVKPSEPTKEKPPSQTVAPITIVMDPEDTVEAEILRGADLMDYGSETGHAYTLGHRRPDPTYAGETCSATELSDLLGEPREKIVNALVDLCAPLVPKGKDDFEVRKDWFTKEVWTQIASFLAGVSMRAVDE